MTFTGFRHTSLSGRVCMNGSWCTYGGPLLVFTGSGLEMIGEVTDSEWICESTGMSTFDWSDFWCVWMLSSRAWSSCQNLARVFKNIQPKSHICQRKRHTLIRGHILLVCVCVTYVIVSLCVYLTKESSVTEGNHGSKRDWNIGSKARQSDVIWYVLASILLQRICQSLKI